MKPRNPPRFFLSLLTAFALVAAPLLAAPAALAKAGSGDAHPAAAAHHHEDMAAPGDMTASDASCGQHVTCFQQCCTACAHCVIGATVHAAEGAPGPASVKLPFVPHLHALFVPSGLDRPPQSARV